MKEIGSMSDLQVGDVIIDENGIKYKVLKVEKERALLKLLATEDEIRRAKEELETKIDKMLSNLTWSPFLVVDVRVFTEVKRQDWFYYWELQGWKKEAKDLANHSEYKDAGG